MRFRDRSDAGRQLARRLRHIDFHDPVVLALPRGGVPVAFEVAGEIDAPLEVFVARKIGAPNHPEFGIGAIAEGGDVVASDRAIDALHLTPAMFDELVREEEREVQRRVAHYRAERPLPDLRGRDVILVDDGLATGVTAEAALRAIRAVGPRRVILAVPTCAADTAARLSHLADEVVYVISSRNFAAVGAWYENFGQTSDTEVIDLLRRAAERDDGRHRVGRAFDRAPTSPAERHSV